MKSIFWYLSFVCVFALSEVTLAQANDIHTLVKKLEQDTSSSQLIDTYLQLIPLYSNVDIDSCIYYYKEAEAKAIETKDFERLKKVVKALIRVLVDKGMYVEAKNYLDQNLILAHQIEDQLFLANILRIQGNWHWEMSNLEEAFKHYQEALSISEDINNQSLKANILLSYGLLYADINDKEKEKKVKEEALELFKQIEDIRGQAVILNNLGYFYVKQNDFINALIYLEEAIQIGEKLIDKEPSIYELSYAMKGESLISLGDKDLGYIILTDALTLAEGNSHLRNQVIINTIYAKLLFSDRRWEDAINYAKKGVNISLETNYQRELLDLCLILIDCYKALGEFEMALNWIKEKNRINEELAQKENKKEITKTIAKYQVEQKELENEMLVLKNRNQKNTIALIIASLLIVSILIFYFFRKQQALQLEQFRQRIAADLHDDVGSKLNQITRIAKSLQSMAPPDSPQEDIQLLLKESNSVVQNVVDVIWALDQEESELDYLVEKMEEYIGRIKANNKHINISFENENINPNFSLSMKVKHHLLKAFQEVMDLVLTISTQQHIKIEFQEMNHKLSLTIENQFDSSIAELERNAESFLGIQNRISSLGGKMKLGTQKNTLLWQIELNKNS